ncbi:MAG: C1 family peptidase [Siphonobacter sp.]
MQRNLLWAFLLLFSGHIIAQTLPATGLVWDDAEYDQLPYEQVLTKSSLPAQISYESYCPSVQTQGPYSTCVGFACGYYLRTILEAKTRKLTHSASINKLAFSPSYLYEKAKLGEDYDCQQGVHLVKVLSIMKDVGNTPIQLFPYPSCGQKTLGADALAARYRIAGYERLFNLRDTDTAKLRSLKQALAEHGPVVVGMVIPASFYFTKKVWQPAPGENPASPHAKGHALCVIGYDDSQYGGSFRVINSFGKNWADQGFCWVTYRDMVRFVRYGFVVR